MKAVFSIMLASLFLLVSCKDDVTPKPKGYLSLDYPEPVYTAWNSTCPYTFDKNRVVSIEAPRNKQYCWMDLNYKGLKGKLHLTYQQVEGNLDLLLKDAQDLTQKHTIKADAILKSPYENGETRVYGMIYEVEGDAASPLQFMLQIV